MRTSCATALGLFAEEGTISASAAPKPVLNGWKEIALYMGRGVRTVQRWKLILKLPVRRPPGSIRSAAISFSCHRRTELDEDPSNTSVTIISRTLDQLGRDRLSDDEIVKRVLAEDAAFDGKWAAALDPVHLQQIRIIPTGVGEARMLNAPAGQKYLGATWMPDGKRLLVVAATSGHAPAAYVQEVATGAARQVTSEGKYTVTFDEVSMSVSPDGKYCVTTDGESHYWMQPLDGGQANEIKGMLEDDFPLEWHNGSQNIFFERPSDGGAVDVYDLNIATGQHKLWMHFSPSDKTAMVSLRHAVITPDGAHSVYIAQRIYSTLVIAKGIQ